MRYRKSATTVAIGAMLALATGWLAPHAASADDGPSIGESVANALADGAGDYGMADNSTDCMGAAPDWVAYRTDRVVLRTTQPPARAANWVRAALTQVGAGSAQVGEPEVIRLPALPDGSVITPVVVVPFAAGPGEVPLVELAQTLRGMGVTASPDYLLSPSSGSVTFWPGGSPRPASALTAPRDPAIGAGITIAIYDAGLPSPLQSNHPPNVSPLTPADEELLDQQPPFGVLDWYFAAHAVSMGSTIDTIAPGATVKVARITGDDGLATDVTAARRMANTLRQAHQANNWPDIVVNAFGSPACLVDPASAGEQMEPLGLAAVAEAVDRHEQAVLVASAGNRSTSERFYPAAFDYPSVIAVGALETAAGAGGDAWTAPSRSGPPAEFSNYGTWVRAWAPGVALPAHHVNGFAFEEGGDVIKGKALVSGTSFAAPLVAALLAEVMASANVDATTAWDLLAASGTPCPTVGGGTAVALVDMNASATLPATGHPSLC